MRLDFDGNIVSFGALNLKVADRLSGLKSIDDSINGVLDRQSKIADLNNTADAKQQTGAAMALVDQGVPLGDLDTSNVDMEKVTLYAQERYKQQVLNEQWASNYNQKADQFGVTSSQADRELDIKEKMNNVKVDEIKQNIYQQYTMFGSKYATALASAQMKIMDAQKYGKMQELEIAQKEFDLVMGEAKKSQVEAETKGTNANTDLTEQKIIEIKKMSDTTLQQKIANVEATLSSNRVSIGSEEYDIKAKLLANLKTEADTRRTEVLTSGDKLRNIGQEELNKLAKATFDDKVEASHQDLKNLRQAYDLATSDEGRKQALHKYALKKAELDNSLTSADIKDKRAITLGRETTVNQVKAQIKQIKAQTKGTKLENIGKSFENVLNSSTKKEQIDLIKEKLKIAQQKYDIAGTQEERDQAESEMKIAGDLINQAYKGAEYNKIMQETAQTAKEYSRTNLEYKDKMQVANLSANISGMSATDRRQWIKTEAAKPDSDPTKIPLRIIQGAKLMFNKNKKEMSQLLMPEYAPEDAEAILNGEDPSEYATKADITVKKHMLSDINSKVPKYKARGRANIEKTFPGVTNIPDVKGMQTEYDLLVKDNNLELPLGTMLSTDAYNLVDGMVNTLIPFSNVQAPIYDGMFTKLKAARANQPESSSAALAIDMFEAKLRESYKINVENATAVSDEYLKKVVEYNAVGLKLRSVEGKVTARKNKATKAAAVKKATNKAKAKKQRTPAQIAADLNKTKNP